MFSFKYISASLLALAILVPNNSTAKTPPSVMKAYKAYDASMQSGDFKNAIKHAKSAWEEAEKSLGDHALTGDLAFNYGFIEKNQGDKSNSLEAFERSVELASFKESDAISIELEREVELVSSMDGVTSDKKLEKRLKRAKKLADDNGLSSTVYVGELYVYETNICNRILQRKISGGHTSTLHNSPVNTDARIRDEYKKCARIAEKAVNIFDSSAEQARAHYVAIANNYVGYGFETSKNWHLAAMSYQKSREAIEDSFGREHPLVSQTIGRWMNARNFLKRTGKLDFAEANGLCKCWPFATNRKQVGYTKWVDADFPAKALNHSSGYAIVKMDVTDSGLPINVKILNSWPQDVYDKSSLKAAKQLEFQPKTEDEPEGYRTSIIIPYNYYLSEGLNPI